MNERHTTFPSALEAFFLVIFVWGIDYLVSCALYDAHGWLGLDDPYSLGTISRVLANGIIFTALLHWKNLDYRGLFNASRSATAATVVVVVPLVLLAAPCVFVAMGLANYLLLAVFPMSAGMESQFRGLTSAALPQILLICVLAPILEEMLFRGIILRSFLQQYDRRFAILGSAVVFGFYHMNIYQLVGASMFGIAAGWLYERTRSLIPGIAMHAAMNTAVMVLASTPGGEASGNEVATLAWFLLPSIPACYFLRRFLAAPVQ